MWTIPDKVCVFGCVVVFDGLTQTVGAVDGEAHEDDVSVGVGERPQSVVVFLSGRVPQCQLHLTHTTQ